MKNTVPTPVVASLVAGLLMAGCSSMGGSSGNTAMPEVDDKRVCEIQRQWVSMSPDEQSAALNFHLRNLTRTYNKEDVEALRQRVRSAKC